MPRLIALAALACALVAAPAGAARPTTIAPILEDPVPTRPLLLDVTATIPVKGRAEPGAAVDVSARCSLRPCLARVYAGRKGRWRAQLHVVVPPSRRVLFVRVGEAERQVSLAAPEPTAGRPDFVLIGDSLAQGTEPYLPELLPDWRVTVDAARSRFLLDGMAIRETMRKPSGRPVVLAFSLFTNDDPRRAAELATWARASLAGFPDGSCALWATIARPKVGGVSYAEANRQLELAAEEVPGVIVVHWAEAVRAHRRWLREDRVHATPEGYRARAELYAAAAQACPLNGRRAR